jgi:hypothetical protein
VTRFVSQCRTFQLTPGRVQILPSEIAGLSFTRGGVVSTSMTPGQLRIWTVIIVISAVLGLGLIFGGSVLIGAASGFGRVLLPFGVVALVFGALMFAVIARQRRSNGPRE